MGLRGGEEGYFVLDMVRLLGSEEGLKCFFFSMVVFVVF